MKKFRIYAEYGSKSRKSVTFEVPDEVSQYFIDFINNRNEGTEDTVTVEGNKALSVSISILHAEQKF